MQRIAQAPVMTPRVISALSEEQNEQQNERRLADGYGESDARLSKCPRTLYVLSKEYEFGLVGQKPAKLFTVKERGKNKFVFSLRNIFWKTIVNMIRGGYSHNSAIDKVYDVYTLRVGRSVTKILRAMRRDKSRGHYNCVLRNFMN